MFNLSSFINEEIIRRGVSMFSDDIESNVSKLEESICNKSILVIGGAGSIGSSFIKAVLPFEPASLVVADINENALTELTRDLRSSEIYMPNEYHFYPMDYSSITLKKMFRHHKGFDIVANFSAHKHVRSEKDVYSIEALLRNNLINAKELLDLLSEYPPTTYFCVSTDKAVNPVNIMGASKRIMEDLIFSYSEQFSVKTARFANVAFSNGSLLNGFLERISKLQPISAPLDVKRYFVSPEESGQICMLAAMLGNNREIFFPRLEEVQMLTFDLIAKVLLKRYGYDIEYCTSEEEAKEKAKGLKDGDHKYPVYFSKSDTSGEKYYEEFVAEGENVDYKRFFSLGVIVDKPIPKRERIEQLICKLNKIFEDDLVSKERIVDIIREYLPNFEHIETGKSLDGKM